MRDLLAYMAIVPGGIFLGVVAASGLNWVQIAGMAIGATLFYVSGILNGRGL